MKQTLFVKYNRTRKPEYQIRTSIVEEDGVRYVEKAALCLEGQLHIHSFQKKYELLTGQNPHVQVLKPEFPQGDAFVRFPFLKGQSLAERMGSQIREGRPAAEVLKEGLSLIFGEGQEPFTPTPAFEEVFGTIPDIQDESFHVSNVDALFENVMETAEGLWFMDYEWVFEFPVPMGYLRYRNLYYFFERFKNAFGWSDVLGFLAQFDITKEQADIYRAMEEAYRSGKVRAIGVSNFYPDRFLDIHHFSEIKPAVNQVETHVFQQQKTARTYMKKYGTQIMSWGPFAEGKNDFFSNPVLKKIGAKYGKTTAQTALRFLLQSDVVIIPKSTHRERMEENFDIFDFTLSPEDMGAIEALDGGKSLFFSHYDPETVEWFMSRI